MDSMAFYMASDGIRWLSAGRGRSPPRQLKDAAVLWPKSEILETKKAPLKPCAENIAVIVVDTCWYILNQSSNKLKGWREFQEVLMTPAIYLFEERSQGSRWLLSHTQTSLVGGFKDVLHLFQGWQSPMTKSYGVVPKMGVPPNIIQN